VTRAVYVREIADARRQAARRSRVANEYRSALNAATAPIGAKDRRDTIAKVLALRDS
jgi:hypothetical protein